MNGLPWITLKTTAFRWEAEWLEQILLDHQIPARVVDLGATAYLGAGSPAALQVRGQDQWTARLLLSSVETLSDEEGDEVTG